MDGPFAVRIRGGVPLSNAEEARVFDLVRMPGRMLRNVIVDDERKVYRCVCVARNWVGSLLRWVQKFFVGGKNFGFFSLNTNLKYFFYVCNKPAI